MCDCPENNKEEKKKRCKAPALPEQCRYGAAGGQRGLSGRPLRGHQPVCHPRQACYHHAQGHSAGASHPRRARLGRLCRCRAPAGWQARNRSFSGPERCCVDCLIGFLPLCGLQDALGTGDYLNQPSLTKQNFT